MSEIRTRAPARSAAVPLYGEDLVGLGQVFIDLVCVGSSCRRQDPRLELGRVEHDLAVVNGANRVSVDDKVTGSLDVDHELLRLDLPHRPDLLASVFEEDVIADRGSLDHGLHEYLACRELH